MRRQAEIRIPDHGSSSSWMGEKPGEAARCEGGTKVPKPNSFNTTTAEQGYFFGMGILTPCIISVCLIQWSRLGCAENVAGGTLVVFTGNQV